MLIALKRAFDNNIPILSPFYLSRLKLNDLKSILKGNTKIPLIKERLKILNELGEIILIKYNGKFANVIDNHKDAIKLLNEIVKNFESFNDQPFFKRAQLLVSDLNHLLNLEFKNINKLTACADYILPMVLHYYNILEYSKDLEYKIKNKIIIDKNSKEENEIRANTIFAVELIKEELVKRNVILTSMQINDYLWILGDSIPKEENYHLVRTIWY